MFDIGWSELLLIAVVALIVIGPKELPTVLRTFGQWVRKARKMAGEFQGQFQEVLREAEMGDLKQSFDEVRQVASGFSGRGIMSSVSEALRIDDIDKPPETPVTPEIEPPVTPTEPEAPTPETFVEAGTHAAAEAPVVAGEETHAAAEASVVAEEETHAAAGIPVVADEEKTASVPHDLVSAEPGELKDAKAS